VRRDVGMTGEITLRGRILPVGGIREKALAARRAGVKSFILPTKNNSDLQNIPKKLRQGLEFIQVERMNQVLEVVLLAPEAPKPTKRTRSKGPTLPAVKPPPLQ
jgi:ATP-dependent Lon protease